MLGALSSGLLLYGCSLVYGFAGTTVFDATGRGLRTSGARHRRRSFGLVFVIGGLAFKVSAVPFHMWTPDVYEGAPTPVDGLLRRRAEGRRHGAVRPRLLVEAFGGLDRAVAAGLIALISIGSMAARRLRRARPDATSSA